MSTTRRIRIEIEHDSSTKLDIDHLIQHISALLRRQAIADWAVTAVVVDPPEGEDR